ncbi:MAG: hypothetical protein CO093_09290 [Alphaproteobacteria bacterium CG_4_9_14_3_um_filter_47_13]|nr:MAG: hypothetical protein CO093_09290 [Alphaproteobacteria bacterium CG_4_9_14_3_um_filter_47_13]
MSDLYRKSGLPQDTFKLKKAFSLALKAGEMHVENIPDLAKREKSRDALEQFMLDQADAAKLLFTIKDGVPIKEREESAMASYIATFATYADKGFRNSLREFGIETIWFCMCVLMWIPLLKNAHAAQIIGIIGQPSDRTRELMAATIISGYERLKRELKNPDIEGHEKIKNLEHYKRTYPQGLRLINASALPEPLKSRSDAVLRELPGLGL